MIDIKEFVKERRAALLSMNEEQIRAHFAKWNGHDMGSNMTVFWGAVHKAITGDNGLPLDVRKKSKSWLSAHNMQSLDDGDL